MVDRNDSWELTRAITGDDKFATENYFTEHIVGMINALREENEHIRSQLDAAMKHVEVMRTKRAYQRDGWLRIDLETLDRLLATNMPTFMDEIRRLHGERD